MKPERLITFAAETAAANKTYGWWDNEPKSKGFEKVRERLKDRTAAVMYAWFEHLEFHAPGIETETTTGENWIKRTYGGDEGLAVGDSLVWAEVSTIDDSKDPNERRSILGHEQLTRRYLYMQTPASSEYDIYAAPGGHCTRQLLIGTHDVVCWGNPHAPDATLPIDSIDVLSAVFTDQDLDNDPFGIERPLMLERWNPEQPVFVEGSELISELFDSELPEPYFYPDPNDLIAGINAALDDFEALLKQRRNV